MSYTNNVEERNVSYEAQFRAWVEQYSDRLYGYAIQRCPDAELAKDLVQETYLAAWRNKEKYKGEISVKNWLFLILKNKLTDHYRRLATQVALEAARIEYSDFTYFDQEKHWTTGAYPRAWKGELTDDYQAKEFMRVLHRCSGKLQQLQNAVFVMKYMDGLESSDICRLLSISSSNYWVLMHRAKVQLRACLQKNWITT